MEWHLDKHRDNFTFTFRRQTLLCSSGLTWAPYHLICLKCAYLQIRLMSEGSPDLHNLQIVLIHENVDKFWLQ